MCGANKGSREPNRAAQPQVRTEFRILGCAAEIRGTDRPGGANERREWNDGGKGKGEKEYRDSYVRGGSPRDNVR